MHLHPHLSWYDLRFYGFSPSRGYVSFDYKSPAVQILQQNSACDLRYTFTAPRGDSIAQPGPMILNAQGDLVWMKWNWDTTQDFKVQQYRGADYLTYWEGNQIEGRGYGSWYMLDSTYAQRYVINRVGNCSGDFHDFTITDEQTALVTIHDPAPANLTLVGRPESGWIFDGVFQEIEIETGVLLFEWRASEHVFIDSTYEVLDETGEDMASAFDFFHMNSVYKDDSGNYIVSARQVHAVFCIDKNTGDILWTLGGKQNDFVDLSDGQATNFAWQHDARWHANTTLTLFDNSAHSNNDVGPESRGMAVQLDIPGHQVSLQSTYYHPQHIRSVSQGNVQMLDNGQVLVGWGHSAAYSEFSADGKLLCSVHFGASAWFNFGRVVSYHTFNGHWVGYPQTKPDGKVVGNRVYVSWNGATEVVAWRVEVWKSDDHEEAAFKEVARFEKTGFETEIKIPIDMGRPLFRLAALDSEGHVIGVTDMLQQTKGLAVYELVRMHYRILSITSVLVGTTLIVALSRICTCCRQRHQWRYFPNTYRLVGLNENEADRPLVGDFGSVRTYP